MGGYKNRVPILTYMLMGDDTGQVPPTRSLQVGLSDVAYDSTTDEQRKLIFVADHSRIKSYAWGTPSGDSGSGENYTKLVPMHTLSSIGPGSSRGPLAVINGRLLRSNKGSISIWNIDTLATHVGNGKTLIGGEFDPEESWRDDPEDIERSAGSAPDTSVTFQDSALSPARWHSHPSNEGAMLCSSEPQNSPPAYYCITLDIETGKTAGRYLGHGSAIGSFSTSAAADPNIFVTGALDGYARLYDVRHPLPVLTLDVGYQSESCSSALITHPNGIPSMCIGKSCSSLLTLFHNIAVFTGQEDSEQIKLWDIRARAAVYELATGNNAVVALAWDHARNALYAATECRYVDRMGSHHDYRKAVIPKNQAEDPAGEDTENEEESGDIDENEGDSDEDSEDASFGKKWPKKANHSEDYFGYPFDAAGHRLCEFMLEKSSWWSNIDSCSPGQIVMPSRKMPIQVFCRVGAACISRQRYRLLQENPSILVTLG